LRARLPGMVRDGSDKRGPGSHPHRPPRPSGPVAKVAPAAFG
jgi:hypothetical protein